MNLHLVVEMRLLGVPHALRERLRLQRSVLIRCDGTRVEETFCLCNLSCGTTADLADVLLLRMLDLLSLRLCTLTHAASPGNEVDDRSEEGQEDEEDEPNRLREPAELPVTEQVGDDREQRHEVGDEDEECDEPPDGVPNCCPERHSRVPLRVSAGRAAKWLRHSNFILFAIPSADRARVSRVNSRVNFRVNLGVTLHRDNNGV